MIRTLGAALACALCFVSGAARADVARFAVVIGNNRPVTPGGEPLRYADDDAVATYRLLRDAGVATTLLVRLDDDSAQLAEGTAIAGPPDVATVTRALARTLELVARAAQAGHTPELYLYYSGHGDVHEGEGFVALEDGRLSRSALFDLLTRSKAAQNHVFIDACKSYFLAYERGPGGRRRPAPGALVARVPGRLANTGFVLSTSSDRESHEWDRYQGGVLSHELRSALRGAADANLDGRIAYRELGAFLRTANYGIDNPRLRPDVFVRAPHDDLARSVLRWPAAPSLSVRPDVIGHIYLESARGDRVLDAHPAPGQSLSLWIPPERPLFVRRADGGAEQRIDAPGRFELKVLADRAPDVQGRGAAALAFERLFAVPFGLESVQGFRPRPERDDAPGLDGPPRLTRARRAAGGAALGLLGSGLALSALSLGTYLHIADESQRAVDAGNGRIERVNAASFVLYGAGAVAGSVWLWLDVKERRSLAVRLGSSLVLDGRF